MKHEKKPDALLEKLTLAEARERIDEFRHVKPVEARSGVAAASPRRDAKRSRLRRPR